MESPLPTNISPAWLFHMDFKELDELFAELGIVFVGSRFDYSKEILRLAIVHLPYRAGFLGGGGRQAGQPKASRR